jgi:hypothetical protein
MWIAFVGDPKEEADTLECPMRCNSLHDVKLCTEYKAMISRSCAGYYDLREKNFGARNFIYEMGYMR